MGATSSTYTVVLAEFGNTTITLEVTPVAAAGNFTGTAVDSSGILIVHSGVADTHSTSDSYNPPTAPVGGFDFSINSGVASTTNPTITLTLNGGPDAARMAISNFSDFKDAVQENYSATKDWNLCSGNSTCSDGTYTVYVKYYTADGVASNVVSNTIILKKSDQTDQTPEGAFGLEQMEKEAVIVTAGDVNQIVAEMGMERDLTLEDNYSAIIAKIIKDTEISDQTRDAITNFITYGTPSTQLLGAGERAGVVNSFKSAFGKLPVTQEDWNDVIKIANGRWPSQTSKIAEDRATINFRGVYLREPDRTNPHDDAAITVMAYGLRPANRNLESEKAAINIFKAIYGYDPVAATAWDAVRAIAYSGATRN
ncbi:MAG TPA: hypothetical protein VMX18_03045 [Candidatus Bipolaricaulota bacterium]|nr:hypothetical protein [Candidatus Bipolaricaulota bacterium]